MMQRTNPRAGSYKCHPEIENLKLLNINALDIIVTVPTVLFSARPFEFINKKVRL